MTKTFGLSPQEHASIEERLTGVCEVLEAILSELGAAYPMGSSEYQTSYKAFLTAEAFRLQMVNAQENEREERGVGEDRE